MSDARRVARALPPLTSKHVPGGARPTPAPQNGGAPYYGMISPLQSELESGGSMSGYANAYGGFLPRPSSTFTAGAFGPFSPILPVPVDAPPSDETPRAEPRLWQAEVGWNLPTGQPGAEGIKLCDFATLKTLADTYSVARACIQLRKAEIRGLNWTIMPTKDAAKNLRGSKAAAKDFGQRQTEAEAFFNHPDPDYFSWGSWLDALLEEVFVYDALSILMRPKWAKRGGKGLLGSDLDSLCLISGPTIRPLIGLHGEKPRPPAPAYQQYLYGVPRTDLMTMWTERDLEESGLRDAERMQFRGDQLLYLPMVPRRETPYGFPPIERALIPVMSGLQKQGYQLDFFREGTIPGMFISPGMNSGAPMTANQIRELQDALNAIAGDPAWKHKVIVLPPDSKVMPQKPAELADQFDEIVMNQVCMAFDVQPMELGIMPKVSPTVSPGAGNQMAKATASMHERKATKPLLMFLSDIFNTVLRDVCQQTDMQFVFEGLEEDEDEETLTNLLVTQVGSGLASIDEAREQLGKEPWGLPETSDPGWATPTGFIPLGQMLQSGAPAPGMQPDANTPATAQPAGATGAAPGAQPAKPGTPGAAPAKKPAQAASGASTPAHAAAQGATAKPSGGNTPASTTNTPTKTPAKGKSTTPDVIKAAADRRDAKVSGIVDNVAKRLHQVAMQYHDNNIGAPRAVDQGVDILADGYRDAMSAGSQEASILYDVELMDFGGMATAMAQNQRAYLSGLLIAIVSSITQGWLQNRLQTYANTVNNAYNQSVGMTVQNSKPHYTITWHVGEAEHCELCIDRDGEDFTFQTLPGYPGDGGFGGPLCEGGPNCKCYLEYSEPESSPLFGTNTQSAWAGPYYQQQLSTIQQARNDAWQLRQDFTDSLPSHTGAQMRAQTMDQIQIDIADLANQFIRDAGGYPGVSVEPADIPAALVDQIAPAWAKGSKPLLSEFDALIRHVCKGRAFSTWECKHLPTGLPKQVEAMCRKGMPLDVVVEIVKGLIRRVDIDGQENWINPVPDPQTAMARVSGGGGRVFPAHDVNSTEVPGGAPGATAGGEPPRWTPPNGTGTGPTLSDPRPRPPAAPDDEDDAKKPGARGVPPGSAGGPNGPGGAMWPLGGHGTAQAGGQSAPGARKDAKDPHDPNPVDAVHVYNQLLANYPPKAIKWVLKARWIGPIEIPTDRVDVDDVDSWSASHQPDRVDHFVDNLKDGKPVKPGVCVQEPGENKVKIIDGHHRFLAAQQSGHGYLAYVGFVKTDGGPWDETHTYQVHPGSDPKNE